MDTPEVGMSSTLQRYNKLREIHIKKLSRLQDLLKS
jgi:hypothetical protein